MIEDPKFQKNAANKAGPDGKTAGNSMRLERNDHCTLISKNQWKV